MNTILQQHYPEKDVLARRRSNPIPPLSPRGDLFAAYLHEEMRQVYLAGNDHAAILVACVAVESALKDAIFLEEFVRANCVFDARKWNKIEKLTLKPTIERAFKSAVIDGNGSTALNWLCRHIRDFYLHGTTPSWIKDKCDTVVVGDFDTGEVKEMEVKAHDDILLQRHARILADRNVCETVIMLVDTCIRDLARQSKIRLEAWKKSKNVAKPTLEQVERMLQSMDANGMNPGLIVTSDYPQSEQESR